MSTIVTFGACETRRCVNITIVNDMQSESDEVFDVTLERTTDLSDRITLNPLDGSVKIRNDDGIILSYGYTACQTLSHDTI